MELSGRVVYGVQCDNPTLLDTYDKLNTQYFSDVRRAIRFADELIGHMKKHDNGYRFVRVFAFWFPEEYSEEILLERILNGVGFIDGIEKIYEWESDVHLGYNILDSCHNHGGER